MKEWKRKALWPQARPLKPSNCSDDHLLYWANLLERGKHLERRCGTYRRSKVRRNAALPPSVEERPSIDQRPFVERIWSMERVLSGAVGVEFLHFDNEYFPSYARLANRLLATSTKVWSNLTSLY